MFTFIVITNRATVEVDKTIDVLLKTKGKEDTVVLINYNNYHLKYRSMNGLDYRHVKMSRTAAINTNLPKDSNVVILGDNITVTDSFIGDIHKHHIPQSLCSIRVDKVSSDGKFVESDHRIGSAITPKSFTHFAISFNTSIMFKVGETMEETANLARGWGVPLSILPNVRVLVNTMGKTKEVKNGVTVLIPSLKYRYISTIKSSIKSNDRLLEFDSNPRAMIKFINQKISESPNECIIIINPESRINNDDMINKIRGLFDGDSCMVFDSSDALSKDAWIVVPKKKYTATYKVFGDITSLQQHILSYNAVTKYTERVGTKPNRQKGDVVVDNMISIIIPFLYNGDRWSLFAATIRNLYEHTKNYDNIEIIVHEAAPKRHITPEFIDEFELVYLFSEYTGVFHRAWCLNVPARYMAKGETLVFFDGDLIIDDEWVKELISCDKSESYIGWGEMVNLNKKGTDTYLKTGNLTNDIDRVRKPDAHSAAAGINVIPRRTFFEIGGIPESYKGFGYGGEDNSLSFKMISLDVYDKSMRSWK